MKKIKTIYCTLLYMLFCISWSSAQEMALREGRLIGYQTADEVKSLKTVIQELEDHYEVSIVANSDLVETTFLSSNRSKSKSLEQQLNQLLAKSNLTFDKVSDAFYVITDKKSPPIQPFAKRERDGNPAPTYQITESIKISSREITISGTVTSTDGESLPGVNVLLKGTSTGTVTDLDGRYTLDTPGPEGTLVFSFIGYATQEVPINGRAVIDVVMEDESASLEEIVVTAMGIRREAKSLTYSAQVVDG